jgi:tetratricopeptide (TPR) repeat protein
VNAQLVDSRTGANLWARRFEGDLGQGFQFQDRLTENVIGEVMTRLDHAEIELHRRTQPPSPDAYSRVMRGTGILYEWMPSSINTALEQYRSAMQVDPEFAPAYAMASYCYVQKQSYGLLVDRLGESREGAELAWRAAELGKNDAYALTRAAHAVAAMSRDTSSGASLIAQAIALNPNLAAAWYVRGWIRVFQGDALGAISDLDHARRLSPYDRLVFKINAAMAYAYFFTGRHDEAARLALSAIRERPTYLTGLRVAAASHASAGRSADSRVLATRMRELDPQFRLSRLQQLLPLQSADLSRWMDALGSAGLPD